MKYENDFVNEDIIHFKIDGKQFGYKPTTADDESRWLPLYMVSVKKPDKKTGKIITVREADDYLINKCKMQNLIEVPYEPDLLYKIITKKDPEEKQDISQYFWKKLNLDQRWYVLGKLNPKLFSKIMVEANKIDGVGNKNNGDAVKKS